MKHLAEFKVFEIRGYMTELETAADTIMSKLGKSDSFVEKIRTTRGDFDVSIVSLEPKEYVRKYGRTNAICLTKVTVGFKDRTVPTVVVRKGDIEASTLVHELKHAFNYVFGSPNQLKINHIINDISHGVGETYGEYFRISPSDVSMILYVLNREELEAWYHGYAHYVRNAKVSTEDGFRPMSPDEKKAWLDEMSKNDVIMGSLRKFKDGGFDFAKVFRSPERMRMFFDRYSMNIHQKSGSIMGRLSDVFSIFLSDFQKGKNDYSSVIKTINDEINRNCETYWRKYKRLYTL